MHRRRTPQVCHAESPSPPGAIWPHWRVPHKSVINDLRAGLSPSPRCDGSDFVNPGTQNAQHYLLASPIDIGVVAVEDCAEPWYGSERSGSNRHAATPLNRRALPATLSLAEGRAARASAAALFLSSIKLKWCGSTISSAPENLPASLRAYPPGFFLSLRLSRPHKSSK